MDTTAAWQEISIREIPRPLRLALIDLAEGAGQNLNAVIVGVLLEAFELPPVEPTTRMGRQTAPSPDVSQHIVRLPAELHYRLRIRSFQTRTSMNTIVLRILSAHVGLSYALARRPRRRRRVTASD